MERIGFIGMGLMGTPMSMRLMEAGFDVTVWNRTRDKTGIPAQKGAKVADSLAELVTSVDVLMLCVTDTTAVEQLVFSDCGMIHQMRAEQLLVDFSSIDPAATKEMAQRLLKEKGAHWVDAPVSGGVAGAEQGKLIVMCGGRLEDIKRLRPLLEPVSRRVTHMGDVGTGQVTKICNQMLVSCNVLVMAEMMAMAERAGVDASAIPAALSGGFADSIPLQLTGSRMAEREYEPVKWHVKTLLKDLNMANQLAHKLQSSAPMSGLAAELMKLHASQGNAQKDPCSLVDMYAEARD